MKLRSVPKLPATAGVTGTWYRAVPPHFHMSALAVKHTARVASRYNPGPAAKRPFQALYLAENSIVALFEIEALLGSPLAPVSHPLKSFTVVTVTVQVAQVIDLTDPAVQKMLATDAQTLTGDWKGYQSRSASTSVQAPTGIAPTQALGEEIAAVRPTVEGFLAVSAKLPTFKTLVLLPQNMRKTSFARYQFVDSSGKTRSYEVKGLR